MKQTTKFFLEVESPTLMNNQTSIFPHFSISIIKCEKERML